VKRLLLLLWLGAASAGAAVAPVAIDVPRAQAWMGQRIAFFVELRSPGSFAGSASFDLPELPGTLIVKVGSAAVSSRRFGDDSWSVQTHEFALFAQHVGQLDVPGFAVRFARRDGFVGTPYDVTATTPAWHVDVRRPPGSAGIGYLVSTPALEVLETWQPASGAARVGDVITRTITQRAERVPGMALTVVSHGAPDGVRIYAGRVEIADELERGEFVGTRTERLRYLLQQPGSVTLPALQFVWFNPQAQRMRATTLPAVTIDVAAAAAPSGAPATARASQLRWGALVLLTVAAAALARYLWEWWFEPTRASVRRLLRACRRNDASAANAAFNAWSMRAGVAEDAALSLALLELRRARYGPGESHWHGAALAASVRRRRRAAAASTRPAFLPPLNP
jgi:hypothetical protein